MSDIKAVSKLAGVSIATVSRAFSDPAKLSPATLQKVKRAADQLNYIPNSIASQFRRKRAGAVLVMVPDLANAFFAQVLSGIESIASDSGLSLLLSDTHDELRNEQSCIALVRARRVDGVIQLGARRLEEIAQGQDVRDILFVHAIEPPEESLHPSVRINNLLAAEQIVEHVISLGHRNIGVVGGQEASGITRQRLLGYRAALSNHGIRFDPDAIEYGAFSLSNGFESARKLLDRRSDLTALFCMSDEIAIGAMKAVRLRGKKIPDHLSITGFDNIAIGGYIDPPLTTVNQPAEGMGAMAMQMLVAQLEGSSQACQNVVLPAEIVIRASVSSI